MQLFNEFQFPDKVILTLHKLRKGKTQTFYVLLFRLPVVLKISFMPAVYGDWGKRMRTTPEIPRPRTWDLTASQLHLAFRA